MPEPDGSRKRSSAALVEPPRFRTVAALAPMLSVVAAPKAFTVVAVVLTRANVVEPVTSDVVMLGEVPNTRTPEPVSSVTALARLAEDGVARNVATPLPRPDTPVEIGRPVQLVRVPEVGVPRMGVTRVGEVART